MSIESQVKKIDELISKGNKVSYKLALDKIINLQKKIPPSSFIQNLNGIIVQRLGGIKDSIKCYENSHKIDNKNISPLNNLSYIYELLKEWDLAKKYFDKISMLDPKNLIYLINISNFYFSINQIKKSSFALKQAIKIKPNDIQVLFKLARNFANEGEFYESINLLKKIIKIDNNFFPAHIQLINLEPQIDKKYLKSLTEALNNKNINESQKADLYYAIAIAYEKMSKNEDFFKYLKKANKLYKNKNEFKKEKNLKFINSIIYFFKDFDFNDEFNFFNEKKIIFICGLPRSGTTLIEQILSSHTKVSGQGELEYLSWDIDKNFLNDGKFDKNKFDQVLLRKNNILSNSYFKRLKFHEIKENIITDKMPMNFRYLGLINIFFPNSKIILTKRNPKDLCTSIFKNNLPSENMNWTFSEKDIVDYYDSYKKITNFWKEKLNDKIYEVNYEELILDNENQVKKILKFCNLDFEKECLDHSKNSKTKISTASMHQARKPIYKSSINTYLKYEKYLNSLFSNLV
jgi:tetratricopeptide (TPR) repeat protein